MNINTKIKLFKDPYPKWHYDFIRPQSHADYVRYVVERNMKARTWKCKQIEWIDSKRQWRTINSSVKNLKSLNELVVHLAGKTDGKNVPIVMPFKTSWKIRAHFSDALAAATATVHFW